MMNWLIVIAALFLFCTSAYAQDGCETEVLKAINDLKDVPHITDEDKENYLPQLKKALELCREGKTAQATRILFGVKFDASSKAQ
jgi:hypothetical protein